MYSLGREATFALLPFTFNSLLKWKTKWFRSSKRYFDPKIVISSVPCHKTLIVPINRLVLHYLTRRYWCITMNTLLACQLTLLLLNADTASVDFFEAKIRPVFIEHCEKCHNASKQHLNFKKTIISYKRHPQ